MCCMPRSCAGCWTWGVRREPAGLDLGPGAGHDRGRIMVEGTPADLVAARSTLSGKQLAAYVGI